MIKKNTAYLIILASSILFSLCANANNFFIKLEYGILLIVTSKDRFDEAIEISSSAINFTDDVLFQLVTNSFDDPLHLDFLAEELILFYLQNNTIFTTLIELGGHNNEIEDIFYNSSLWSRNISEYHLAGSGIQVDDNVLSSIQNTPIESLVPVESGQFLCMLACGMSFGDSKTRNDHHRRHHKKQYQKLHRICNQPFACKYCGATIQNFQSLSIHIHKCPSAKYYTDFLE